MTVETLQNQQQLIVRQRIRLMVNQYEVHAVTPDGREAGVLAFAQQKRCADRAVPQELQGVAAAFSVAKKWGVRDRYVVTIHDPRLDRRLVVAMAVALDALQSR